MKYSYPVRLLVLWTFPSDYLRQSLISAVADGHRVLLVLHATEEDLPPVDLNGIDVVLSSADLRELVKSFNPDVILVAGWHVRIYRKFLAYYGTTAVRVITFDAQWLGTVRQKIGRHVFKFAWRKYFDYAIIPGERQKQFALRLGFEPNDVFFGSIPCNSEIFRPEPGPLGRENYFFMACRLAPEKGLDVALQAHKLYSASVESPWPLVIAGRGKYPQKAQSGVIFAGILAPHDIGRQMRRARAFVLASTYEPWGVVIHEATSSGLPVIASDACGSVGSLLLNGVNGLVAKTGDAKSLAVGMLSMSSLPEDQWQQMSRASVNLSRRATSETWIRSVQQLYRVSQIKKSSGLC